MIVLIKEHTKQEMHNAAAHHPWTNAQPVPERWQPLPGPTPPVLLFSMRPYGMGHPSGPFGSAVILNPNTAARQLLGRKLALSQPKPERLLPVPGVSRDAQKSL